MVPDQDNDEGDGGSIHQGRLGIQGRTITPETIQQMRLKLKNPTGVFVVAVQGGSPAADAGLVHGDVIHRLDRSAITTVEELAEVVKALEPGDYMIEVERSGRTLFLTLTIE